MKLYILIIFYEPYLTKLLDITSRLYYWREGKWEVDFVLQTPKDLWAIEVKSGLKSASSAGLEVFSKKYPKARCETWDYEKCSNFLLDENHVLNSSLTE
jgi:predicted AAA+ superfamily ATPase